jgi:hypothetical protein
MSGNSTRTGGIGGGTVAAILGGVGLVGGAIAWKSSSDAARAAKQEAEEAKEELREQKEELRDLKASRGGATAPVREREDVFGGLFGNGSPLVDFIGPIIGGFF